MCVARISIGDPSVRGEASPRCLNPALSRRLKSRGRSTRLCPAQFGHVRPSSCALVSRANYSRRFGLARKILDKNGIRCKISENAPRSLSASSSPDACQARHSGRQDL
jgi:hypothetical protein